MSLWQLGLVWPKKLTAKSVVEYEIGSVLHITRIPQSQAISLVMKEGRSKRGGRIALDLEIKLLSTREDRLAETFQRSVQRFQSVRIALPVAPPPAPLG